MAENVLEMLHFAKDVAIEAGKILLTFHGQRITYSFKELHELVTEADLASDELIRRRIREKFPGHSIISEEADDLETGSEYKWVVDPVDGTYPFFYKYIDHWGVCIGLCRDLIPIAGVIFAPERNELFEASTVTHAKCNGEPIHTSKVTGLKGSFIGLDAAVKTDEDVRLALNVWKNVRFTYAAGCASIPMCLTAKGIFSGYIATMLKPWDMAAAVIINQQAGNTVTNRFGKSWKLGDQSVVIANPFLHPQLLALFS